MPKKLIAAAILALAVIILPGSAKAYYAYVAFPDDCIEYSPYCVLYDYPYSTYHYSGYPYWWDSGRYWGNRRYYWGY
jgi:hypothetical protein